MKRRQKTEISLEFEESVSIRFNRVVAADCRECGHEVRMVAAKDAAILRRVSELEIHRLVKTGQLHYREDTHGLLYICCESLIQIVIGH